MKKKLNVFVGCEYSGKVRDAFIKRGHKALSCDLLDTDAPGPHYKGDIFNAVKKHGPFDIGIFHPPCTYLTVSGLHWNKRDPKRAKLTEEALHFVVDILNLYVYGWVDKLALENPVGCISTRVGFDGKKYYVIPLQKAGQVRGVRPAQIIQPYNFGANASKKTCLWLLGLPVLQNTTYVPPPYGRWQTPVG